MGYKSGVYIVSGVVFQIGDDTFEFDTNLLKIINPEKYAEFNEYDGLEDMYGSLDIDQTSTGSYIFVNEDKLYYLGYSNDIPILLANVENVQSITAGWFHIVILATECKFVI